MMSSTSSPQRPRRRRRKDNLVLLSAPEEEEEEEERIRQEIEAQEEGVFIDITAMLTVNVAVLDNPDADADNQPPYYVVNLEESPPSTDSCNTEASFDQYFLPPSQPEVPSSSCTTSTSTSCGGGDVANKSDKSRKRQNLDHLSLEERTKHRKMQNRAAAQNARDRDKQMVIRQKEQIKDLTDLNEALRLQNESLKKRKTNKLKNSRQQKLQIQELMDMNDAMRLENESLRNKNDLLSREKEYRDKLRAFELAAMRMRNDELKQQRRQTIP